MHDSRLDRLAHLLVHHSTRLQTGDNVLIEAFDVPPELTVALVREAAAVGARPMVNIRQNTVSRALLQAATEDNIRLNAEVALHQMQQVQAYIAIRGGHNSAELSDVPGNCMKLYQRLWAHPVHLEHRVKKTRWCVLRYPSPSMAQEAQMSTEAFENFYFDVCTMDYARMRAASEPLHALMAATDQVHIVGPGTDLRFSIKDIGVVPCFGTHNVPDGECFTAPVRDSVQGTITFNAPTIEHGVTHENVRLAFKDGQVVEATSSNTAKLNEVLDSDVGARYIGEFSIAFNPIIQRPMKDILFDEKIAGSFHFTPGQAYEQADNGNRSDVHWDMVCIQRPEFGGGQIFFDDRLVRQDGLFVVDELLGLNPDNLLEPTMAALNFAAVDLGAESGRVVTGAFDGSKVALDVAHRFPNTPVMAHGTLHWDALRLWHDIQDGLGHAARSVGHLDGVGVDTWGVDFALLDGNDALLGNPVHYRDRRNEGMIEATCAVVPREQIFASTGLQFLPFNTLFQLMALKRAQSPQLEMARTLLFIPDLLHFWLTGQKAVEYTIASTSQMLAARSRQWDGELLRHLGLPTTSLPTIVAPGTALGPICADVAARTGLAAGTPVIVPGSHDTASAVAAVPAEGSNWAYLSSGTWSLMGVELDEPLINDRVAELGFTNEGGLGNKIRFLKNIAGLWLVQECRRSWAREGQEHSYEQLAGLAEGAAPLQALIDPDDAAFMAPADMPAAIAQYCRATRQQPPRDVAATVRCCVESLALKYRWTFERLEELRGARIEVLHIVGGGTQNKLLSQLTADCLGRRVVAGPVEATAAGNLLTQAMAKGAIGSLAELRAVVRNSFMLEHYEPEAARAAGWDEAYGRFRALMPQSGA